MQYLFLPCRRCYAQAFLFIIFLLFEGYGSVVDKPWTFLKACCCSVISSLTSDTDVIRARLLFISPGTLYSICCGVITWWRLRPGPPEDMSCCDDDDEDPVFFTFSCRVNGSLWRWLWPGVTICFCWRVRLFLGRHFLSNMMFIFESSPGPDWMV